MLPLGGVPMLCRVIRRVEATQSLDEIIVATTNRTRDDIVERTATREDIRVVRGSERNVLDRTHLAATEAEADIIVRVTSDCPLVSPEILEVLLTELEAQEVDYVSTGIERTFPYGLVFEAFSYESFDTVQNCATTWDEKEHVTPYYYNHPEEFEIHNVRSQEVFDKNRYHNRTDLRLTIDEPNDYELFQVLYDNFDSKDRLGVREAIDYIDKHDLSGLNKDVIPVSK